MCTRNWSRQSYVSLLLHRWGRNWGALHECWLVAHIRPLITLIWESLISPLIIHTWAREALRISLDYGRALLHWSSLGDWALLKVGVINFLCVGTLVLCAWVAIGETFCDFGQNCFIVCDHWVRVAVVKQRFAWLYWIHILLLFNLPLIALDKKIILMIVHVLFSQVNESNLKLFHFKVWSLYF